MRLTTKTLLVVIFKTLSGLQSEVTAEYRGGGGRGRGVLHGAAGLEAQGGGAAHAAGLLVDAGECYM